MVHSLGVCIGASTIKIVMLSWDGCSFEVVKKSIVSHDSNPKAAFQKEIAGYAGYDYVCITGRKLKDSINLPAITEPEATEHALKHLLTCSKQHFNALISLGSENFILYELDKGGNIVNVASGNKCASGTGEFFLQQVRRMDTDVGTAISLALTSEPYKVSGRCSVFCKSDCTHALNRGTPIGNVCAGLGDMISEKVIDLLRSVPKEGILLVGGVTKNSYVMRRLKGEIKNAVIAENADVFEALGAAIYAHSNRTTAQKIIFREGHTSFTRLSPLADFEPMVDFRQCDCGQANDNDACILGLDVGSTTTKAALIRRTDNKMLASVYLRTNGNPVAASRNCYADISRQVGNRHIRIIGLGVTGSGRHISGLHAMTDSIINEIIAHATAAAFFDADVDTILEIGGQDAKYTFLVNGVPCDYAMNEACSAGTGSFLEEAAKESLNICCPDIQDMALRGEHPPNFNDQCAAFISSDIKNASHENMPREDIVAGLVYSICMNYNNRVKGHRKVGERIFMQGGVCYNKAVPIAMAAILGKRIIVPPEPGLMGAFGAALEVKSRLGMGLAKEKEFSLKELASREVGYGKSFTCKGGSEKCDRKCIISIIQLNGGAYPFGGICNKYYNQTHNLNINISNLDFVEERQALAFRAEMHKPQAAKGTVGIARSYLANNLFPLYQHFFTALGFKVIVSGSADKEGMARAYPSFCFPAELSYGMFMGLIKKKPDYIFLPQVAELYIKNSISYKREFQSVCVIAQSEPYYIKSAFKDIAPRLISPVLNFRKGWDSMEERFADVGRELGAGDTESRQAYKQAIKKLEEFNEKRKGLGDRALEEIAKDKTKIGIILFGRAYNAFAEEANLGIPKKFSSRGVSIIPFDCLRYEEEESIENMTWATGQEIIKAARLVKKNEQLFGAYITNFSCGPDSFLIGYFRDIMGTKPSLTLELDSHSADAGITTRIEAFLDIVDRFRKIGMVEREPQQFIPAGLEMTKKGCFFVTSNREAVPIKSPNVKIVFPSMGRTTSELGAAAFRGLGFNSEAVALPNFKTLLAGRGNTCCKECLPLILTVGSLVEYLSERKPSDELLIYFMPTAIGNCRFSQYYVFLKRLIEKKRIENVALMTLTSENSYAGIGVFDSIKILKALIIADIMDDIKNAIAALAADKEQAMGVYERQFKLIQGSISNGGRSLYNTLSKASAELSKIKLKQELSKAKRVILSGEIYVRKDEFATQGIIDRLSKRGIVVQRAPVLEWLCYVDYLVQTKYERKTTIGEKAELFLRKAIKDNIERRMKGIMAASGLYEYEKINVKEIIEIGRNFVDAELTGETILGIGSFFKHMACHAHGMISVGPFACLPTRVTESILATESKIAGNKRIGVLKNAEELRKFTSLPFLTVECDGNPFPQVIEARIEAFCLQVETFFEAVNRNS